MHDILCIRRRITHTYTHTPFSHYSLIDLHTYTNTCTLLQAIAVLNHAGISVSYTTAWKYRQELIIQSDFQQMVRSGRWLWVFDNVNMLQKIRHERQGTLLHINNVFTYINFVNTMPLNIKQTTIRVCSI